MAYQDVAGAEGVAFLQVKDGGQHVCDVIGVPGVAGGVVWVAGVGGVGRVRGEAVVEGGEARDFGGCGRVGEEVGLSLREGGGGDRWVTPGAAVDVDYEDAGGVVWCWGPGEVDGEGVEGGGVGVGDVVKVQWVGGICEIRMSHAVEIEMLFQWMALSSVGLALNVVGLGSR